MACDHLTLWMTGFAERGRHMTQPDAPHRDAPQSREDETAMTTFTAHNARRGVTLIEAVLFIAVALGLIVGGLVAFQQAQLAARTNQAARSLSAIASEVRAQYRTQPDFIGLTDQVLIGTGSAPVSELTPNNVAILNPWNDLVLLLPNSAGISSAVAADATTAPVGRYFEIEYRRVPEGACSRLARAKDGVGAFGPGLVAIRFRSGGEPNITITGVNFDANGRLTVTPDQAAAACSAVNPPPVHIFFTLVH
jgi:type II secretory pathway pseudopilin PulG